MSKRYILFFAKSDLTEEDVHKFTEAIRRKDAASKVIAVKGNSRALIVKTTNRVAPLLRDAGPALKAGKVELLSALTSGAIGNLKRRASAPGANGEVS